MHGPSIKVGIIKHTADLFQTSKKKKKKNWQGEVSLKILNIVIE